MNDNRLTQALQDEDFITIKKIVHEELYEKIAVALEEIKMDMYPFVFDEAKKAKKTDKEDDGEGMDPVGAEDSDVDNDGDSDESDDYLKNRRNAVGKSIKNRKDEDDEE